MRGKPKIPENWWRATPEKGPHVTTDASKPAASPSARREQGSQRGAPARRLDLALRASFHLGEGGVQREGEVDAADDEEDDVAVPPHSPLVVLGDAAERPVDHLLPAEARVEHEDKDREEVEGAPAVVLEDLELQPVDVPHRHGRDLLAVVPEQVQVEDAPEV